MVEPTPTNPHAEYDRYMARSRRRGTWWRRFGQIAGYIIGGALAVVLALITVVGVIDLGQPRIWGTFHQTDCEPKARGGCRPLGIWVSDDGATVKRDVYLDGWTDDDGAVRASYQPTAVISDESNNIVHAEGMTGLGPVISGALLVGWVGYMLFKAVSWGDIRLHIRRRQVDVYANERLSPRREFRRRRTEENARAHRR